VAITEARLYLYRHTAAGYHAKGTSTATIYAHRKTADWSEASGGSTATDETWNSGASSSLVEANYAALVAGDFANVDDGGDGTWVYIPITGIVRAWKAGSTVYGILLINATSESNAAYGKEFYSRRSSGKAPYIWIDYTTNVAPTTASLASPIGGVVVNTLTPTLDWTHNDPDGDAQSAYEVQVDADSNSFASPVWASGQVVSSNTQVVVGTALARGPRYFWRVRTRDPSGLWGPWNVPYNSSSFFVNSLPVATLTEPVGSPGIATPYYVAGAGQASPYMMVRWGYSDADGQAQTKYQVEIYSDSAGVQGALFYGSGEITSSAKERACAATFVEGSYYWARVRVFDGMEWSLWTTARRVRMRWAVAIYRKDLGSVPTAYGAVTVVTNTAANQAVTLEYNSNTSSALPTDPWRSSLASVTKRQWLFYRVWLFGWGSAASTPALDGITINTTLGVVQPDLWQPSPLASIGASIEASAKVFGTQSLRIEGSGGTRRVYELVDVEPDTDYILQGRILSIGNSGAQIIVADSAAGAAISGTGGVTADQSFMTMTGTYWNSGPRTQVYVAAQVTGAVGTAALFDGLKLEPGRVASPWVPGLLGAGAVVDAGGVQVDASAGGIMRLRTTDGRTAELDQLVSRLRYIPLIPIYNVASAATTTSNVEVPASSPEITVLPTTGVKAIVGGILGQSSVAVSGSYVYVQNWGGGGVGAIVYATTATLTASLFLITTGGTNNRQMQYTVRATQGSAATLTYYVRVIGYWTEL